MAHGSAPTGIAVDHPAIAAEAAGAAARSAARGLDWLNLFVANIQTGFGPFVAVYLTSEGWTQTAIGFALSLGTVAAMASQVPAGALVDAVAGKRRLAAFSIAAFALSALLFAIRPDPLLVYLAEVLHGASSCVLGPALVAMSLAIAGRAGLALRLGRNGRYASIGNGIGAALMGACGYYLSARAVFLATAGLCLPALACLLVMAKSKEPRRCEAPASTAQASLADVLRDPRLRLFAACAALFTLANAAMLPLASVAITKEVGSGASLLIAAGMVVPQLIVALLSPHVGAFAAARGRRPIMLLGFAMLPLKGLLFATMTSPILVVIIQAFDGIAGACFGVLVPLVTSDIAGRSRHLTLPLGVVGFAIGIGATLGTTLTGSIADHFGQAAAFASLGTIGLGATLLVWAAMPETRSAEIVEDAGQSTAAVAASANPFRRDHATIAGTGALSAARSAAPSRLARLRAARPAPRSRHRGAAPRSAARDARRARAR
jgi:MFS family permease